MEKRQNLAAFSRRTYSSTVLVVQHLLLASAIGVQTKLKLSRNAIKVIVVIIVYDAIVTTSSSISRRRRNRSSAASEIHRRHR